MARHMLPPLSLYNPLKPRILCIDDEAAVGEFLKCMLESTGDFHVEVETKAIGAVGHARQFRPDLVILDIKMPGPDGFALARDLRREPWLRHKPIVFYSGMTNTEDAVRKAWQDGPTEFLEKGVAPPVIEETVRRILSERIALFQASEKANRNRVARVDIRR